MVYSVCFVCCGVRFVLCVVCNALGGLCFVNVCVAVCDLCCVRCGL